ncbi:hypothetical protein LGM14_27830, partial [Burkholderia multivorans]|nr:hypothetical protein [Burkholderia multivorans]MDN7598100.1 hypothetical protein [Burkholderia multivorans]
SLAEATADLAAQKAAEAARQKADGGKVIELPDPKDPKKTVPVVTDLASLYREAERLAENQTGTDAVFVNSEHMVVDRDGHLIQAPHVRTANGEPVYLKADGAFTTDLHGAPLPAGVVLLNDRGDEVDERGRPINNH